MKRTQIIATFYLLLIFSFSSTLEGFSTKGGGHNTITSEAAIQGKNEKSGNYHFMTWLDGTVDTPAALSNFYTGAFDEDCTPINTGAVQELPLDGEWPTGPNGWGTFFEHFFNPRTGAGLGKNRIMDTRSMWWWIPRNLRTLWRTSLYRIHPLSVPIRDMQA